MCMYVPSTRATTPTTVQHSFRNPTTRQPCRNAPNFFDFSNVRSLFFGTSLKLNAFRPDSLPRLTSSICCQQDWKYPSSVIGDRPDRVRPRYPLHYHQLHCTKWHLAVRDLFAAQLITSALISAACTCAKKKWGC
jgi:hypothetical protein